ncbi:MAG: hypothetical protein GC134_08770 [Proteobacteria bacterium]|nr:hypothetical protein [Pseudomonadota bacterium]
MKHILNILMIGILAMLPACASATPCRMGVGSYAAPCPHGHEVAHTCPHGKGVHGCDMLTSDCLGIGKGTVPVVADMSLPLKAGCTAGCCLPTRPRLQEGVPVRRSHDPPLMGAVGFSYPSIVILTGRLRI